MGKTCTKLRNLERGKNFFTPLYMAASLEKQRVSNQTVRFSGIHLLVLRWTNRGDQGQSGCCQCPSSPAQFPSIFSLLNRNIRLKALDSFWVSGYCAVSGVLRGSTAVEGVPPYVLLGADVVFYIQETLQDGLLLCWPAQQRELLVQGGPLWGIFNVF